MELVNSTNDFLRAAGAEERAANAEWAAGCDEVAEVHREATCSVCPALG